MVEMIYIPLLFIKNWIKYYSVSSQELKHENVKIIYFGKSIILYDGFGLSELLLTLEVAACSNQQNLLWLLSELKIALSHHSK